MTTKQNPMISSIHRSACAALLALCVAGLTSPPAGANYRTKAIDATNFIQRSYYDQNEGLYRPAVPINPKALPFDLMWGNGVQLSALVGAEKWEPERYGAVLSRFSNGLRRYFDTNVPLSGFDAYFSSPGNADKYYDDNAWVVLGLTEAYRNTKDPNYLKWAQQTQTFVQSGWDDKLGGGIYWHQQDLKSKNTCSNAPAIVGALALYDATGDKTNIHWARKTYDWTRAHLQDPTDGLFWDNMNLDGKIEKTKWTYNTALMIRAGLGLWRATKDAHYLAEARREADASLTRWVDPESGAFADDARFNHLFAEALLQTFEATQDLKYLNAVRRNADFGYRQVRDVRDGGYFNSWNAINRPNDERKDLIQNAAVAREFWLLVPYPDTEELKARAQAAAKKGDTVEALRLFDQLVASTAGAVPTQAPH